MARRLAKGGDGVKSACVLVKGESFQNEAYQLINEARRGNGEAYEALYEKYYKLIYHIIWKFTKNPREVEELYSVGLLGLVKAVKTFDCTKQIAFTTYLAKIVENEIKMWYRQQKKWRLHEVVSLEQAVRTDENDKRDIPLIDVMGHSYLDEACDYASLISTIGRILRTKFPKHKEAILYMINGHTQKQAAYKFGISQSYASRLYQRFKELLEEELKLS